MVDPNEPWDDPTEEEQARADEWAEAKYREYQDASAGYAQTRTRRQREYRREFEVEDQTWDPRQARAFSRPMPVPRLKVPKSGGHRGLWSAVALVSLALVLALGWMYHTTREPRVPPPVGACAAVQEGCPSK